MAISVGDIFEIAVAGHMYGQQTLNVWTYRADSASVGITAAQLAEAYWAHVKAAARGIPTSDHGAAFEEVRVRQLAGTGGLVGTYIVPAGERGGTRTSDGNPPLTPFAAAGVRLVVGTSTTRSGQKRFGGIGEGDNAGGLLAAGAVSAVQGLLNVASGYIILGAPAALLELVCVVVRKDKTTGAVLAHQDVVGTLINPYITTQNTRKVGRGS